MINDILVTGYKGTIGTVVMNGLGDRYRVRGVDLPEYDLTDLSNVIAALECPTDAILHFAWNANTENFRNRSYDYHNTLMFYNVYKAALEKGVKRVIMASSLHTIRFYPKVGRNQVIAADSLYGANKIFLEEMGKVYAYQGLEVVCIRFGGVNKGDEIDASEVMFDKIWLSHGDCCSLMAKCLQAVEVPNNFVIVDAVSNNYGRLHDTKNPFGWSPVDDSRIRSRERSVNNTSQIVAGLLNQFPINSYR